MTARLRRLIPFLRDTSSPSADGELVSAVARSRDETAFAELVKRHGPMVLSACKRILHPDTHAADDAFQAAFLVLALKADTIRPPERVGAWLHGVAVRVARRAKAWGRKLPTADPLALGELTAPANNPDVTDLRAAIDGVLAGLPTKYRAPVVLCDLEERSRADAASALGWTEGTLSGRLARGRRLLADRLARRGVTLPAAGLAVVLATSANATVPPSLSSTVLRTAALVAIGAPADGIPAAAVRLALGVPTMPGSLFKLVVVAVLALGGLGLYSLATAQPPTPPPPPAQSKPTEIAKPAEVVKPTRAWVEGKSWGNYGRVTALAVGSGVVVAGDDQGHVVLWDATTGKKVETMSMGSDGGYQVTVDSLTLSQDGTMFYKRLNKGEAMHQWHVKQKGRDYNGFGGSGDWVYYGLTGDSKHWLGREVKKLDLVLLKNDHAAGKFTQTEVARFAHPEKVTHAASDADVIVSVAGLNKPVLRRWDATKEKVLWSAELGTVEVTGVTVSPGGKLVAITGDGGTVQVYDAASGKEVSKATGLTGTLTQAAFAPDGTWLVVGCRDGSARVLDAETGKELTSFTGHDDRVLVVAVGPDGTIATGGADKAVKVWAPKAK